MSFPRKQQPTLDHSSQYYSSHATDESRQADPETDSIQLEPSMIASQLPSLYEFCGLDEPWKQESSSPQSSEEEPFMAQYHQHPEIYVNVWQESYIQQWHGLSSVHQEHQEEIQHPYNATTSYGNLSGGTTLPVRGRRSPQYGLEGASQFLRHPKAQTNEASACKRSPSNGAIGVPEHDALTLNNTNGASGIFHCNYDCQKSYRHKSALERHIRTKHIGETLKCDICHERFIGRADVLARHRGNHTIQHSP